VFFPPRGSLPPAVGKHQQEWALGFWLMLDGSDLKDIHGGQVLPFFDSDVDSFGF
jgi:hypothetical protein